jgi:hypothetical protein
MRTNKKILITVAGFLMAMLIIFLLVLHNTLNTIHAKAAIKDKYIVVSVGAFEKLDFSSHFIVRIRHEKECFIEVKAKDDSVLKPKLENINGTLYLKVDSAIIKACTDSIHVRIAMPALNSIKATGSKIHLESFDTDSLHVVLGDGCVFTGHSNTLRDVTYKTSGEVLLRFTQPF